MSDASMPLSRTRAVARSLMLAAALAAAAAACGGRATDDTKPAQPQSANGERLEAFAQQVGIDMAEVPIEIRREWASAPRLEIDDCAIPGTHAGPTRQIDTGRSTRTR